MAEPTQQEPSTIDRLMGTAPGIALRTISPGVNIMELLRQLYRRQGTPGAPAAPGTPAPPAPTGSGAPAQPQGPARQPARTPTVTPGAASTPAPAPEGGGEARPSLLDTLRETVQQDATPENTAADRLAAFAAGMTSGNDRRRGFFGDLLAGVQAQQQSDAAHRAEMLRSIQAQAGLVEADRKAALEKAKEVSQAREREQHGRYYEAMANLSDRRPGTGTGNTAALDLRRQALELRARQIAQTELAKEDIFWNQKPQEIRERLVQERAARLLPSLAAQGEPAAPAAPAVPSITPLARPAQ